MILRGINCHRPNAREEELASLTTGNGNKNDTSNTHTLNKFSTISHLLLAMDNGIRLLYLLLKSWDRDCYGDEVNCWRADGSSMM